MKRWKMAVVLVMLALPMMGNAKGGSSFNGGGGSSFSRGFSSHGSTSKFANTGSKPSFGSFGAAKSAAIPAREVPGSSGKTSFGSFGSPISTPTELASPGQKSKSALTQNLDKNAAQTDALNTLDARNNQKAIGNTPVAANGMPLGGVPTGSPSYPSGQMGQPYPTAPPTVIYQNGGSSGNFTAGLIGFMLGRSMHGNDHSSYPMQNGSYDRPVGAESNPQIPTEIPKESSGMSFLRIILWLLILSAIGGSVWYFLRRSGQGTAKKSNYSL